MIYLTDKFNRDEQKFIEDVISSGIEVVVLTKSMVQSTKDYARFLPFIFMDKTFKGLKDSSPLFALNVEVPKYWSINMGYEHATIWDKGIQRGVISYMDEEEWTVGTVEWWDIRGKVISKDFYTENGFRFKQEVYNNEDAVVSVQYYDLEDNLIMIEDVERNLYTVFIDGNTYIYDEEQLWRTCVNNINNDDILVTGELNIAKYFNKDEIKVCYTDRNIINDEELKEWLTLIDELYIYHYSVYAELPENDKIHHMSPLYPNKKLKRHSALIITHTQDVEKIEELTSYLPEVEFHIGAITAMGSRLTDLVDKSNVFIYPGISQSQYYELLNKCSIYLDINHYIEILNSVEESLENGMLLFSFKGTCHREKFIHPDHLFETSALSKMIDYLKGIIVSEEFYNIAKRKQLEWIQYSDIEMYRKVFQKEDM